MHHAHGLVLLCTYKAVCWLICTMTHMRINRGCLLLCRAALWGQTSEKKKKLPWDRKGLKIFEISGWLCCEGGHSAPCPTVLTSVAPRGWSCCQGTHWTCDELPLGSDWGRRALSRAAALTEPLSVCSCWWIVWYTEQCSPWLYYWVCLFNYCVYIQNDVLVWLFASSATLFLATTVTSYSTVTKDSAYKTHGDFIHYDALSYIGPGNPTVYISRGQTLCQLKDQCVSSSGI